jgi:hypothetical protein
MTGFQFDGFDLEVFSGAFADAGIPRKMLEGHPSKAPLDL